MNYTYGAAASFGGIGGGTSKTSHIGAHPLYRGYSPSKPKWKNGQNNSGSSG